MKKLISLLLSAALVASLLVAPASAAASKATESEMIQTVNALGIMVGDTYGNMNLSSTVTRAEFITMAVKATPGGDKIGTPSTSPFPDVTSSHWAAGYVQAGVQAGLISGYTDGTFRPTNQITLAEGYSIALKLLGYTSASFTGTYPSSQMAMAANLGLDDGLSISASTDILTREDSMKLFYNLLTVSTTAGQTYLNTLGYSLNASGEIDLVSLVSSALEGPLVAGSDWQSKVDVTLAYASVYVDGVYTKSASVQTNDVLYWSDTMNSIWIYRDQITGTIQSLSPSSTNPTAITLAGQTYSITTSAAAYALSNLGEYSVGDRVTLLLGMNDDVVGVASSTVAADTTTVGMITAISLASYSSGTSSYTADTFTIQATDGNVYSYPFAASYYNEGDLVRVTVEADGDMSVERLRQLGLSGTVSADGTTLGTKTFATNVEIMDVYQDSLSGAKISTTRLLNLDIATTDVLYYELDSYGKICRLILDDVTGDCHQYGVLTDITAGTSYDTASLTVDGTEVSVPLYGIRYTSTEGPVQLLGTLNDLEAITSLTSITLYKISGDQATSGYQTHTLADDVQYYQLIDDTYYLTSASRIANLDCSITGYYDKAESDGGRIRVVIAE